MGFVRCPLSLSKCHAPLLPAPYTAPSTLTNSTTRTNLQCSSPANHVTIARPSYYAIGWSDEQGARSEMEDSFAIVENFGEVLGDLFVGVYDGHGGKLTSELLRCRLHSIILEELLEAEERRDVRRPRKMELEEARGDRGRKDHPKESDRAAWDVALALRKAFMRADEELRSKVPLSGSTACVCLMLQDYNDVRRLYCAHLGDARAVLGRSDGTCQRLTAESDHKSTDPAELASVAHRGAYVVNDRVLGSLAVSRAFGDPDLKQPFSCGNMYDAVSNVPDVSMLELATDDDSHDDLQDDQNSWPAGSDGLSLQDGTFTQDKRGCRPANTCSDRLFIVACDGLWDVMSDETAVIFVLQMAEALRITYPDMCVGEAAECLSRGLVEEALQRQTKDNVTAVVVLLHPLGFPLDPLQAPLQPTHPQLSRSPLQLCYSASQAPLVRPPSRGSPPVYNSPELPTANTGTSNRYSDCRSLEMFI